MKENFEAYFRLSSKEIEIAGPIEYVKEQLEAHSAVINQFVEMIKIPLLPKILTEVTKNADLVPVKQIHTIEDRYVDFEDVESSEDVFKKFENIVTKTGDKIQILVTIPGDRQTQRMVNVILIYSYLKLKLGTEVVSFDELRLACETHGELDKAHFAQYIKINKKFFVTEGLGKTSSLRLTIPAIRETERILNSLNIKN